MTRFDDFPDDDFIETERQKKRPQKSSQEELEERIYNKRCQLVKLAHSSDYSKFLEFLRENENILMKMDDYGKECIRLTCQSAWENSPYSSFEDIKMFDRMFEPYIDIKHSKRVPTMGDRLERSEPKMTIEEEIAYRSRGSYYAMWDFISNPEWQDKLKGRTDLYDRVKYMIDRAKRENLAVSINFKRYEPSDEDMYVKVLELMKE